MLCQRQATFSGIHHFKCPLCNNADEFTAEMLKFGIYIPDQSVAHSLVHAEIKLYMFFQGIASTLEMFNFNINIYISVILYNFSSCHLSSL